MQILSSGELHIDQGKQFESGIFQNMCKMFGIIKTRTSPYHPQGDGQVERFNRTIEDMLSMYVNSKQHDWDLFIPMVLLAYRSSVHSSTGFSPNRLMFGREVRLPIDLALGLPRSQAGTKSSYLSHLQDSMVYCSEIARDKLRVAAEHQKDSYTASIFKQLAHGK